MEQRVAASTHESIIDRRIRWAMRVFENEQTPLPKTIDVARRVGMSPFHFVRLFTAQVGTNPQDYGRSLIMMHAASRIRYSGDPIEMVARDFGYANQASFSKAFTRHHGLPPARWRRRAQGEIVVVSGQGVRLVHFPAQRCLARRYLGPRRFTGAQWEDFIRRLPRSLRDRDRLGFAYDDPRVTPPERIRHDCAFVARADDVLTEAMIEDGFETLEAPAGTWAVVDVDVDQIAQGYRTILDGWFQRKSGYALEGDPHLERYVSLPSGEVAVSVCMRVRLHGEEARWNMVIPSRPG